MADKPTNGVKDSANDSPEPEVLKPRNSHSQTNNEKDTKAKISKKARKGSLRSRYRLGHKGTLVGLVVVVIILAVNAGVIIFVVGRQAEEADSALDDQVTISQDALSQLGVNRASADDLGAELIVGPNARFDKAVQVAGNVSVGGELILNDRLSANGADFANLQAGDTALEQLNVNGDGTLTNISVRQDLTVAGTSRLQGPTTVSSLLTVEGSANVSGNLTVGGSLSVNAFQTGNLIVNDTVTIGGKIITRGSPPSASVGPAAGSNGTVSISGNDTAGTVAFNAGTGAGGGIVANVSFRESYGNIPRVVVTPIGDVGEFYIFRDRNGFSIGVGNSVSPGGYAFDYIVMQ